MQRLARARPTRAGAAAAPTAFRIARLRAEPSSAPEIMRICGWYHTWFPEQHRVWVPHFPAQRHAEQAANLRMCARRLG